jgi:hypothetical protein
MAVKPKSLEAPKKLDAGDIDVDLPNRPSFNTDIDVGSRPGFNSSPGGAVQLTPQSLRANVSATARAAGDALQNAWNSIRGGPKKPGNLVDGAASKPKPLPDADVPKTKQDLIDGGLKDGPDTDAALKNADELAKDPGVSRTLTKWGVRGGVGVIFLMMIYKTANPFEALSKAGKDAKEGAKGLSELMNSIFEAIKGLLGFLTQNWMVSAASSCCCVLLMLMPMLMSAGRSIAPRPSRFGGAYY